MHATRGAVWRCRHAARCTLPCLCCVHRRLCRCCFRVHARTTSRWLYQHVPISACGVQAQPYYVVSVSGDAVHVVWSRSAVSTLTFARIAAASLGTSGGRAHAGSW